MISLKEIDTQYLDVIRDFLYDMCIIDCKDIPDDYLAMLISKLHQHLGTSVKLTPSVKYSNGKRGKGRIEIDFYDNEELSRLLEIFGVDVNEL